MPWNGGVTNSTVNSNAEAHGPKEMDRLNKYFKDLDLETDPNDGSVAGPIRTRTIFRDGKLQFIGSSGNILTIVVPALSNNQSVTLPDDTGTISLSSGGGAPIDTITDVGAGVGVHKQTVGGVADFYSLLSLSSRIDIALNAGSNVIEFDVDETALSLSNIGGTLPVNKGGTGQTTANAAFGALSPMTTNGDLITRASGVPARIAPGTDGNVLTMVSGAPAWAAGGGGGGGAGIMDDWVPSGYAWGWQFPHGPIGGGILNNVASDIVEQEATTIYDNSANRGYGRRYTGVDAGNEGWGELGFVSLPFRRELSPFVDFWLRCSVASGSFGGRMYAFFSDDSTPARTSDTPLDSSSGFGIMAQQSGATNWRQVTNDGDASQNLNGSNLFTRDTTIRHIRIEADEANSKWIITVNGSPTDYTYASVDTPAASTPMYFYFLVDESGGSDDQLLDIYRFKCGYKIP